MSTVIRVVAGSLGAAAIAGCGSGEDQCMEVEVYDVERSCRLGPEPVGCGWAATGEPSAFTCAWHPERNVIAHASADYTLAEPWIACDAAPEPVGTTPYTTFPLCESAPR